MPFVKLDCGLIDSTLWIAREARDIFLTALLMAEPREFVEPLRQLHVDRIEETGFVAPPGWYGFINAAGAGIIRRSLLTTDQGMQGLRELGEPDQGSRSSDFDGRRLIRIDGGYVILNFMKYRDKDHTAAERQKRFRDRRKAETASRVDVTTSRRNEQPVNAVRPRVTRNITEAEAEAEDRSRAKASKAPSSLRSDSTLILESDSAKASSRSRFEEFWNAYPNKKGKHKAEVRWRALKLDRLFDKIIADVRMRGAHDRQWLAGFIPHGSTYVNGRGWEDGIEERPSAPPAARSDSELSPASSRILRAPK